MLTHRVPEHYAKVQYLAWNNAQRRLRIVLTCALCGERNYRTTKANREGAPPLRLKKFCVKCNTHTEHREAV